jgi:hypothetical protein
MERTNDTREIALGLALGQGLSPSYARKTARRFVRARQTRRTRHAAYVATRRALRRGDVAGACADVSRPRRHAAYVAARRALARRDFSGAVAGVIAARPCGA